MDSKVGNQRNDLIETLVRHVAANLEQLSDEQLEGLAQMFEAASEGGDGVGLVISGKGELQQLMRHVAAWSDVHDDADFSLGVWSDERVGTDWLN